MIQTFAYLKAVSFASVIVWLWTNGDAQARAQRWPSVAPLHESVYFADARKAEGKFTITGIEGKALYAVECHTSDYEGDLDFDYSGDFECRLKSLYSKDTYSTLFTDNPRQSRDWESRARFLVEELVGQCGDYPEYGRVRQFKVRGMKITLTLSEVSFKVNGQKALLEKKGPELHSFRFDIRVESDASAVSEITEPVPYAEPPYSHPEDPKDLSRKCDVVKKRM